MPWFMGYKNYSEHETITSELELVMKRLEVIIVGHKVLSYLLWFIAH